MTMQLRKAERKQAKLRIGMSGPSGSGKTYSSLLLARGLASSWEKIAIIDSENGSGELYSDLGPYNVLPIAAPFSPEKYIEAIKACEEAGMEVIVIDSTSHEWDGSGGCLEINELIAKTKFKGNTWSAWSETTPRHQRFIAAIVNSTCHIVTTARAKTDTIQTEDKKIKKVGMKEIQREGFEYELTVNFNLDRDGHYAVASKDRTGLFIDRDPFLITQKIGQEILTWNGSGKPDPNVLKRQIMAQLKRLDIDLPPTPPEVAVYLRLALPQLVGLDLTDENLSGIVEALTLLTPEAAKAALRPPQKPQPAPKRAEEPAPVELVEPEPEVVPEAEEALTSADNPF